MDDRFRVFKQFQEPELAAYARSRQRLEGMLHDLFGGERLQDRLARALIERRAVNLKELLESFEFHHRVRRRVRRPIMADLFCGHGLTGLLFAASERQVERMLFVDQRRPKSFDAMLEAVTSLAPWVADKVEYVELPLSEAAEQIPPGSGLLAVHACGFRTDDAIELATRLESPLAAMPCCYATSERHGPPALVKALGRPLAIDVDRTYRLEAAGVQVDWAAIPAAVTPMNRILIGWDPT